MRVLVLEDDLILSNEVVTYLKSMHIDCDAVFDGELFFRQINNETYDLYILDINVPKLNGLDVCKKIRETDKNTPILMLTAYREIQDKLDAFTFGADDYLVKPFHFDELYVRLLSLHRRSTTKQEDHQIIKIKDLEIDLDESKVKRNQEVIELTPKEFQLLVILAKAKGRTLSKNAIAEQIWDVHFESNLNTIEVYINFLRKKIDKNFEEKLILTRPGFGYYINVEE
ncbi:Two-component system response regulatory protein [Flavobacterium indicum GPTSA100-9 = DSM 17447]|uniref:Two-component system response regulatory protein n=1 Tax=Flavobacterium indicum (strain DSM 17447 / CIP 109464 / GPTSA100-9) TaxID=1094466 RepID=H8XRK0_FLAIG|nr:response regulator transcription factor [Flavobacterium indicum]CCG54434.1 Two-component system response regulatory protein [Flavobacterium indicum GPTSA100-9 = DSM 17447]